MDVYQTTQNISDILFEIDPVDTCCKENECFDEYDTVSFWIANSVINRGESLSEAIRSDFYDCFNVELEISVYEKVYEKLKDVL